jgi:hypothetical protein
MSNHDCVVVPGIGALMVRYKPACFEGNNSAVLLPPSRELAFNSDLAQSDGVLETSVARRNGISFEAARRMVNEEAESLLHQLKTFGELSLGHLGTLVVADYGAIVFTAEPTSSWDYRYYGLRKLNLTLASAAEKQESVSAVLAADDDLEPSAKKKYSLPPIPAWNRSKVAEEVGGGWRRSIVGIAASLAVIITVALFFLNPIKLENEPLKASLAPASNVEVATSAAVTDKPTTEKMQSESEVAVVPVANPVANVVATQTVAPVAEPTDKEAVKVAVVTSEATEAHSTENKAKTAEHRFNSNDPFCVIVASFPDAAQAERYISENNSKSLGVLQQDGKYRVYAATGKTYEEAAAQKSGAGQGAWICRR